MKALIVIEVEVPDGQRPGTPYARLRWVAESLSRFTAQLRRVQRVVSVAIYTVNAASSLGHALFTIPAPGSTVKVARPSGEG